MADLFTNEELMNKIRALTHENENLRNDLVRKKNEISGLHREIDGLHKERECLRVKCDKIALELRHVGDFRDTLGKENEDLRSQVSELKAALEKKQNLSVRDLMGTLQRSNVQSIMIALK